MMPIHFLKMLVILLTTLMAIATTHAQTHHSLNTEERNLTQEEEKLNQDVRLLWDEINQMEKRQHQAADITILPITPLPKPSHHNTHKQQNNQSPTPISSIKAEKERIDALLQNNKEKNSKIIALHKDSKKEKSVKAPKTPPAIVNLPMPTVQPKPVLTRKQVLEQEIEREKAALKSAQSQLKIAQKRGHAAQAAKLIGIIKDRQLNVQAISREIAR